MTLVPAEPGPFAFDPETTALVVIDMQRDFLEPGGFGSALGNDVSLLSAAVEPLQRVLAAARELGMTIIHTREGHRPDMADCPPAKFARGEFIGTDSPKGRILIRGEYGHDIVDELAPLPGEVVLDKPGKGSFYATDLELMLRNRGHQVADRHRRHHRGLRAHDRARGQRPRLRVPRALGLLRFLLPRVPRGRAADDLRARRDLRLGGLVVGPSRRPSHRSPRMTLPFWTRGDLNAFFGLGINMLVNVLVLAGLCIGVVNIAPDDVYGVILPALGIELLIGNIFYFYLARRLAMKEKRNDVTALPYGPSVPHMFIVTLVIMLPTYLATQDADRRRGPRASRGPSSSAASS